MSENCDPRAAAGLAHENLGTVEQRTARIARRYWVGQANRSIESGGLILPPGVSPWDDLDGER